MRSERKEQQIWAIDTHDAHFNLVLRSWGPATAILRSASSRLHPRSASTPPRPHAPTMGDVALDLIDSDDDLDITQSVRKGLGTDAYIDSR